MKNLEETKGHIESLMATLKLRGNYSDYLNGVRKMLLVEGRTDSLFLTKVLADNVFMISVAEFIAAQERMSHNIVSSTWKRQNNKAIIVSIVLVLQKYAKLLPHNMSDAPKWKLYGLIDSDGDTPSQYAQMQNLFQTDTSDIETIILSTDTNILTRVGHERHFSVEKTDWHRCMVVAYQYACLRRALIEYSPREYQSRIKAALSSSDVDFPSFIELDANCINVVKLVKFALDGIAEVKIRQICIEAIRKDGCLKKAVCNKSFCWKKVDLSDNLLKSFPDFWNTVNGHVLLALLKIICPFVGRSYPPKPKGTLDRQFECDIIHFYDYACFSKTEVYRKMHNSELLQDLPN